PLGALPYTPAYAAMLTLGVAALLGAAALLAPLATAEQRARLLPFALLAPPSLIALVEGQTSAFVLLALAASLRAPPFWSGALLGATRSEERRVGKECRSGGARWQVREEDDHCDRRCGGSVEA